MVQPMNYLLNGADPMASMQQGLAFGQQQRMGEQDMLAQKQGMDLQLAQEGRTQTAFGQQNTLFEQGQQDRVAAMQAQEQARAAAMQMQSDMAGLAEKVGAGLATSADFAQLSLLYPDMAEELGKVWDGQTADRKAADIASIYSAATAIKSGRPDIAVTMLEERATAAEASGDKMEADMSRAMAQTIKASPESGLTALGMLLHSVDEKASVELFGAGASELPADIRSLQFRANAAGLVEGTQEYKDFMQSGGGNEGDAPASFRALEMQAAEAGLVKGSPEYQQFMLTKGAGSEAEARTIGTNTGQAVTDLPGIARRAEQNLALIDEVLSDPALPSVTGNIQGRLPSGIPLLTGGQAGENLQVKLEQIQGQVFLTAYDDLRGAGAITEQEGQAAKAAIARMKQTQDIGEYKAALAELKDIITRGLDVAREKAGATSGAGSGSPDTPVPAASFDDAFSKYGATP